MGGCGKGSGWTLSSESHVFVEHPLGVQHQAAHEVLHITGKPWPVWNNSGMFRRLTGTVVMVPIGAWGSVFPMSSPNRGALPGVKNWKQLPHLPLLNTERTSR